MEPKSNSPLTMEKKPNESLNSSREPRNLTTSSSAEIRKDVERATGRSSHATHDEKDPGIDPAEEAKGEILDTADDAQETASRMADKVQRSGRKAIEATSAMATTAINVAERKVRQVQSRIDTARSTAGDYIQEDPVRAVTYTAIGSAVLTAALIGILRRR